MPHNGYFYPEDIITEENEGKRSARVGWELPVVWTEEAFQLSKVDFTSGWEVARQAYREQKSSLWFSTVYPTYHKERTLWGVYITQVGSEKANLSHFNIWKMEYEH